MIRPLLEAHERVFGALRVDFTSSESFAAVVTDHYVYLAREGGQRRWAALLEAVPRSMWVSGNVVRIPLSAIDGEIDYYSSRASITLIGQAGITFPAYLSRDIEKINAMLEEARPS